MKAVAQLDALSFCNYACRPMSQETFGAMAKTEKIAFILEQVTPGWLGSWMEARGVASELGGQAATVFIWVQPQSGHLSLLASSGVAR